MHRFSIEPTRQSFTYREQQRKKRFVKRLKLNATPQEIILHGALLTAFAPYRVTVCFQEQIGPYVADFFLYPLNVVVEVDGGIHKLEHIARRDQRRNTYMQNKGIKVLRFSNEEVAADTAAVAQKIIAVCGQLPKPGDPVVVVKCPPGSAIHGKKKKRPNRSLKRVP